MTSRRPPSSRDTSFQETRDSSQPAREAPSEEFQADDAEATPERGGTWTVLPRLGLLLVLGVSGFFIAVGGWQWGLVLLAISSPAICGGMWPSRWVQKAGVALMGIAGGLLLLIGAVWFLGDNGSSMMFSGLGRSLGKLCFLSGLCLGGGAFLLSSPWWRSTAVPPTRS